jgi:hypothetical protein
MGETELSGNDAYAVTLPVLLSNFFTIDNHARLAKCFALLLRTSGDNVFLGAPRVRNLNFLAWFCGVLRTVTG